MWQASVTSFLFVSAAARGFATDEGVSLLQTQAQLHTQKESISPGVDNGLDLPDPQKQSSASGMVEINNADTDFECKNGKGKWVWIAGMGPETPGPGNGQQGGKSTDLSEKTRDIQSTPFNEANGQTRALPTKLVDGKYTQATYTDHGPVTSEKDCFHRAKIDQMCNHWVEDIVYSKSKRTLGVWYNGNNPSYTRQGLSTCLCGHVNDLKGISGQEMSGKINAGNRDGEGFWFCQFLDGDRGDENTPKDVSDIPKEKKSPEEKAACKAAKTTNREDKAALKALRQQMKALRAQLKAAKEKFKTSKDAKEEAC